MAREGTAVDAAIATLLCNGVVNPHSMGIGGGFMMTIHLANGTAASLIAREKAPSLARPHMYAGGHINDSLVGPKAISVPGEIMGYWEAKEKFGNPDLPWSDLFQPVINLCINGIRVSAGLARALDVKSQEIDNDHGLKSVFINPNTGDLYKEGEFYKNFELARTFQRIAKHGWREFYIGTTALMLAADIRGSGGLITMKDLKHYRITWEKPVMSHIPGTDFRFFTSPPPGSGSLVAAILGITSGYSPEPLDKNSPLFWHRFLESCKHAFAMRTRLGDWNNEYLGNDVREVVGNLTSPEWWEFIRTKIIDDETFHDPAYYGAEFQQVEDGGTSHISIVSPAGKCS